MKKEKILRAAQRKAGMPGFGRVDVIRVVCERMNVPMPETWNDRYRLMKEFAGLNVPKPVKAPKLIKAATQQPLVVKGESRRKRKQAIRAQSDAFLLSYEWRRLRMEVIKERGARCECCGATPKEQGIVINVDHVKPRKLFPELALEKSNLQVLCEVCNHGKGNWDQTDWRSASGSEVIN